MLKVCDQGKVALVRLLDEILNTSDSPQNFTQSSIILFRYLRMKLPKYDVKKRDYELAEEHNAIQHDQEEYSGFDYDGYDNTQGRPELMMTQFPEGLSQFPAFAGNASAPGLGNMFDMMKRTNHKINLKKVKSKIQNCFDKESKASLSVDSQGRYLGVFRYLSHSASVMLI